MLAKKIRLQSYCSTKIYHCTDLDIRIIIRLNELISAEQTGSPKELASRLNISIRTVFNYIAFMKSEMQAPIVYNYQRLSYVYENECEFNFIGVEKSKIETSNHSNGA